MDTKLKKSKYNPFLKLTAIFLTALFAFSAAINGLSLIRKEVFYASDRGYSSTPSFTHSVILAIRDIASLKPYVNTYRPDMTHDDFLKTDYAKKIIAEYDEKEKRAIKIFNTIQELKKLKPDTTAADRSGRNTVIIYKDSADETYYDPNTDTWMTWSEVEKLYADKNLEVHYYDDYEYENNAYTTMVSISVSIPPDDELFKLDKSYSSYEKWNEKYQQLRKALFSIVSDATSTQTITDELEMFCTDRLNQEYDSAVYWAESTIDRYVNLKFILKDNATGNFISNTGNENELNFKSNLNKDKLYYIDFDGKSLHSPVSEPYNSTNLLKFLNETDILYERNVDEEYLQASFSGYTLYVKLNSNVVPGDAFYNSVKAYEDVERTSSNAYLWQCVIFSILSICSLTGCCFLCGRREDDSVKLAPTDRIPFVISFLLHGAVLVALGAGIVCTIAIDYPADFIGDDSAFWWIVTSDFIKICIGILAALFSLVSTSLVLYIARNCKAQTMANRFIIGYTFKKLSALKSNHNELSMSVKQLRKKTIIALAGFVIINLILLVLCFTDIAVLAIGAMAVFNTVVVAYAIKYINDVSRLSSIAEQIKSGTFNTVIRPGSFVAPLRKFSVDLIACRDSIESAIDNAIKGEHLKTELITNVSHDLKTPLTSIINYVSLLKMGNIKEDETKKYLDILDDKSKKLQRLIEDLVEASKATTGNIKMTVDTVNLNELALQAVGENSDVLENAGLDLVLTQKEDGIFVKADSQHTFRIIDNLFSNARKYSLTGTRVYVDVYKENEFGVFAIKNISREKLNITPDELTERFVRGDNSRSTDGSGLGLSIARSFTELQNGVFKLEIDGDMFRAIVKLPLTNAPANQTDSAPATPQPQNN